MNDYEMPPLSSYNPFRQESAKPVVAAGDSKLEQTISNPLHVVVFDNKVIVIGMHGEVIEIDR